MKILIKIAIITIIGFGFSHQAQAKRSTINTIQTGIISDTFKVSNMSCHKDANLVTRSLYRLSGVRKVEVKGETVIVKYDSAKVTSATLKKAIEGTGTCEDPANKVHKAKKK